MSYYGYETCRVHSFYLSVASWAGVMLKCRLLPKLQRSAAPAYLRNRMPREPGTSILHPEACSLKWHAKDMKDLIDICSWFSQVLVFKVVKFFFFFPLDFSLLNTSYFYLNKVFSFLFLFIIFWSCYLNISICFLYDVTNLFLFCRF